MANVSVGTMLKQMAGLVGTDKVNDWETRFLKNVLARTNDGARTSILTADQVEKVEQIWQQHFA